MENNDITERPEITEKISQEIFKDYKFKIHSKMTGNGYSPVVDATDINNMIILLNWCFKLRNNFFSSEFNRRRICTIQSAYNTLKTNILINENNHVLLTNIDDEKLKVLKFVLSQYITVYDSISKDDYHNILCRKVSKDSIKRCVTYVTGQIG